MNCIQNLIKQYFSIDNSTSATILISLLVFFFGLIVQTCFIAINNFIKRKNTRNSFLSHLNIIITRLNKQSLIYEKMSRSFIFSSTIHGFEIGSISSLYSIGKLEYSELYHAFFTGIENFTQCNIRKKFKAFSKTWMLIDSSKFWFERSNNDIKLFIDEFNNYNEKRNHALEKISSLINKIILGKIEVNFEFKSEIEMTYFNWQREDNRTRQDVINRKLVVPLRLICRKRLKEGNSHILELNEFLLEASHQFEHQYNLLKTKQKQYTNYSIYFRNYSRVFKAIIKILS